MNRKRKLKVFYFIFVGISCFGPSAKAAQIEASKSFSKQFMERHRIPTARFETFTDPSKANEHINR